MLLLQPYVRYEPGTGKVIGAGNQGVWFTRQAFDKGEKVLLVDNEITTLYDLDKYVDLSGSLPQFVARPRLNLRPDTLTPKPGQEVSIDGVPACTVTFTGPSKGSQTHDGKGPMKIGWMLPGTYVLSFDPWPFMSATLTIKVQLS
jgi:hypothetical protein